jgi:hypothetical protein
MKDSPNRIRVRHDRPAFGASPTDAAGIASIKAARREAVEAFAQPEYFGRNLASPTGFEPVLPP